MAISNTKKLFRVFVLALAILLPAFVSPVFAQDQDSETAVEPEQITDLVAQAQSADVSANDLPILLVPLTHTEMAQVVEAWQGHVRSQLEKTARLNIEIGSAEGATKDDLRDSLTGEQLVAKAYLDNFKTAVSEWSAKGATPEELKPYQDYALSVTSGALRTTDLRTLASAGIDWMLDVNGGLGILLGAFLVLISVWILMFVAKFVSRTTRRGLERFPTISRMLKSFVATAVYWAVMVLGTLIVLGLFGVNVTPLFAVFGGLSFILGFALQETLGNLASGLMIMVLKPFDTGDYIQIGSSSGFVDEMSVVSTKIRTFDNQIIVVPNSKIWGDVITNVSASEERRVDLVFGIAYSDNAAEAIEVLNGLVGKHSLCLKEPAPEIFVGELGDNSVNIFCRPWCKNDEYWTVYWDLTGQAKEAFDAAGISIPFPQRDVHLIPVEGSAS
ncbi:mechanosensitive ion channel family protein [Primorskyibacter sp. S87]|uniref:mechanosensitive ion channel family protein n=1 Tax=Primorskyibacter sp. S87 TaxID=3415126 RepID=UPI003C7AC79C